MHTRTSFARDGLEQSIWRNESQQSRGNVSVLENVRIGSTSHEAVPKNKKTEYAKKALMKALRKQSAVTREGFDLYNENPINRNAGKTLISRLKIDIRLEHTVRIKEE